MWGLEADSASREKRGSSYDIMDVYSVWLMLRRDDNFISSIWMSELYLNNLLTSFIILISPLSFLVQSVRQQIL